MGVETATDQTGSETDTAPAFNRTVDWILAVLHSIGGLLFALAGTTLYYDISRPDIAEAIHNTEFRSDQLTEAEVIDTLVALGRWAGIGLVVAGGLLVLLGIAVVIAHGRARDAGRGTPGWVLGVVGAAVESILSFILFSPLLGGAVSGYLGANQDASGVKNGALAGVIASVPALVVAVFAGLGLFLSAPGEVIVTGVITLAILGLLLVVYLVGLSALGGYLGGWVRNR